MLHEFLANYRDDLIARCRVKAARQQGSTATIEQLENGLPIFLEQLIRTLQAEQLLGAEFSAADSLKISGVAGSALSGSEIGASAARHGKELLVLGFTVDEVVHGYGSLYQAITDLAVERNAPFQMVTCALHWRDNTSRLTANVYLARMTEPVARSIWCRHGAARLA